MGTITVIVVVAIFLFSMWARSQDPKVAAVRTYDRLGARGVRGRALVLASAQLTTGTTMGGRRFELRPMSLEIEVPGSTPYEVNDTFAIPRGLVQAVPGSTLDIAVDPANPRKIAVLGPGGFTGPWLSVGPPAAF